MENNLPRPVTEEATQLPQSKKSHKQTLAMALGSPLLGGIGMTGLTSGILKFETPNPPLIIGGVFTLAAGVFFAIKGRSREEREGRMQAEVDIKKPIEIVIPLILPKTGEIFTSGVK